MIHLPRLRRDVPIVENGVPTLTFHQWMDKFIKTLEDSLNDINTNIALITAALDAADKGVKETARLTSYTNPTSVLTATDAGTSASITIAAHTRVYPVNGPYDIPDVAVSSGVIDSLSYSTKYYVYYDDENLSNTRPSYFAVTAAAFPQVGAKSGRHFVGTITTPAAAGAATTGTGATPIGNGVTL